MKQLRRSCRAPAVMLVAVISIATACSSGDDAAETTAETAVSSITDKSSSSTTLPSTTAALETTAAPGPDLPDLDAATLDACSLITAEMANVVLGATANQSTAESPETKDCSFVADEKFVEVSVRPNLDTKQAISDTRAWVDENCRTSGVDAFGPGAFEAHHCETKSPTFRALYVFADGRGIVVGLDVGRSGTSEVLAGLTAQALANAV